MPKTQPKIERRRLLQFAGSLPLSMAFGVGTANAQQPQIPTASDSEGPYYISNVPVVENLNRFGKSGKDMQIQGRVLNAASPHEPVAGARLELWQTDGKGKYYPKSNGDYADYADQDIDMRGTVLTDTDGRFSVMSLFPSEYWPRPPHIHYWIHAEGYRSLVTQHYLDTRPRNRPHRTAKVDWSRTPALFSAPIFYLQPA